MAEAELADESRCWVDGCHGARFDRFPECFAHLGATARTEALAHLRPGADLDLRGTELTAEHLAQILDACRQVGQRRVGRLRGDRARFAAESDFRDLVVKGVATFDGAHFGANARFARATFQRGVSFESTAFLGSCDFRSAGFHRNVHFRAATFERRALFVGTTFDDVVSFEAADFQDAATFDGSAFAHDLRLENARFRLDVTFEDARFGAVEQLGPFVAERVTFDRAQFDSHVTVDLRARELSLAGARLAQGGVLRLQKTTLWLDGAVLGGTTAVVGAAVILANEAPPAPDADREAILGTAAIASIRGVDAGQLVLSGVDLTNCRFSAAYQLDRLRIEGRCRFGSPPKGFHPPHPGWPQIWWWTQRRTIIEEHRWRARQPRRSEGWTAEHPEASRTYGWRQPTHPERVAAIYRQLRKAFEDGKDEPGAADFYYGEMEMRRLSPSTPRAERGILTLYWLFAGYGLRAGRALVGLLALVVATTGLLAAVGFADPRANTENALRTALDAVVFRSTAEELTTTGVYVEMVARVLGPVLLALAALSVRNRVKR